MLHGDGGGWDRRHLKVFLSRSEIRSSLCFWKGVFLLHFNFSLWLSSVSWELRGSRNLTHRPYLQVLRKSVCWDSRGPLERWRWETQNGLPVSSNSFVLGGGSSYLAIGSERVYVSTCPSQPDLHPHPHCILTTQFSTGLEPHPCTR